VGAGPCFIQDVDLDTLRAGFKSQICRFPVGLKSVNRKRAAKQIPAMPQVSVTPGWRGLGLEDRGSGFDSVSP
jgi:hypothetical protein